MYEERAENVRSRIKMMLKTNRITENSVAAGDSAVQSRLNSQLSHGKKITLDTILRVLDACPDISADWLLRGGDAMYKGSIIGANNVKSRNATVIGQQTALPVETLSLIESELLERTRQNTKLLDMLSEKDSQIATLLKLIK